MAKWSVELEPQQYRDVNEIINDELIVKNLEETKEAAKDIHRVRDILARAQERSFLKNADPGRFLYAMHRLHESTDSHISQIGTFCSD